MLLFGFRMNEMVAFPSPHLTTSGKASSELLRPPSVQDPYPRALLLPSWLCFEPLIMSGLAQVCPARYPGPAPLHLDLKRFCITKWLITLLCLIDLISRVNSSLGWKCVRVLLAMCHFFDFCVLG